MLEEFEKLYNAKKTDFDDLALVKKAMAKHNEEKKKFEVEYLILKTTVINPVLAIAVGEFKKLLTREGDEIKKLTAQSVGTYFDRASNHIEGFIMKVKGKTIVFSIDCNIEEQKMFTTLLIKDSSFKIKRELDRIEFSVGYIQKQVIEAYNYINQN